MNRPLQIFVIGIAWPPETFIARKLYGLAESGFIIHVPVKPTTVEASGHANVRLWRVPYVNKSSLVPAIVQSFRYFPYRRHLAAQIWECWRLAAASTESLKAASRLVANLLPALKIKPDIVHFEWNSTAIAYLPFYDLFNCPVVISNRGSEVHIAPHNPRRAWIKDGLGESFRRAAAVHCVSNAICDEAVTYGMNPEKAWVIRPAVDPNFFTPSPSEKPETGTFTIVSTGSIIWVKGYEYALMAVRRLVEQGVDVRYQIIGDGVDLQRVLYTIDDLDLQAHVQVLGKQTPERVRDYLQQADAFLLASLSEGISNAALEAMACGLPVVTTDCGGMREAVRDGVEGFVVPMRAPDAMAYTLTKLADDAGLRRVMGAASRQRILEQFTLAQQIEQFRTMYFSLVRATELEAES